MGSPVRHASCSHATPCPAMSCSHPHLEVMRIARCGWPPCLHPARQSIIGADEVNFGVELFFFGVDGWLARFFPHDLQGFLSTIPAGWPCFFWGGTFGGSTSMITESYMRNKSKAKIKIDRLVLSLVDFKRFLQFLRVVSSDYGKNSAFRIGVWGVCTSGGSWARISLRHYIYLYTVKI